MPIHYLGDAPTVQAYTPEGCGRKRWIDDMKGILDSSEADVV